MISFACPPVRQSEAVHGRLRNELTAAAVLLDLEQSPPAYTRTSRFGLPRGLIVKRGIHIYKETNRFPKDWGKREEARALNAELTFVSKKLPIENNPFGRN